MGPKESSAGTLVIVADPTLQEGMWNRREEYVSFYNKANEVFEQVNPQMVRAVGVAALPNAFERSEVIQATDYLRALPGSAIGDIIMGGRFDLALLLNSDGGVTKTRMTIEGLAHHSREHGGKVSACVGKQVGNEATLALMAADPQRRLLLPGSKIKFSADPTVYETYGTPCPMNAESQLARWGDLKAAMARNAKPDKQPALTRLIEEVESRPEGSRSLQMSGKEADELGIARIAWTNPSVPARHLALMGRFAAMHDISTHAILESNGVGGFFGRQRDYFKSRLVVAGQVDDDQATALTFRWMDDYR